jgi:hypothetical protein
MIARPTNRGRKNMFVCSDCGGHIVTVDADEGIQPMVIACHATLGCKGLMGSSLYKVFDQKVRASFEFYRPPVTKILTPGEAQTVAQGGLLLRFAEGTPPEGLQLTMGLVATLRHIKQLASSCPPATSGDADPSVRESNASRTLVEIVAVCDGALAKVPQ